MTDSSRIDHSKKHPSHVAYCVRDGKEGHKARWSEIGAAWATKDGRGYILHLNALQEAVQPEGDTRFGGLIEVVHRQ